MKGGLSAPMLAAMKAPEKGDPAWLLGVGGPTVPGAPSLLGWLFGVPGAEEVGGAGAGVEPGLRLTVGVSE